MIYNKQHLRKIFDKTSGRCHLCGGNLCFGNFGKIEGRGTWEIEHSVPRSLGGTDNSNNLFPSHISCNRSKSNKSNRSIRKKYGRTRAPYSVKKCKEIKEENAVLGGFAGLLLASLFRTTAPGLIFTTILGAVMGHNIEPDK